MITLASDFGTPYPAAMKGVILDRLSNTAAAADPDVRLVDIAHDFPRQDVRAAAFWLRETLPYFPPAVHLVVVDPGVGTDRAALVLRVGDHALVGPDNGVLLPPARRLAAEQGLDADAIEPFEIVVDDPASATFHGRDVFAPAAAAVHAAGVDALCTPDSLSTLEPADGYVDLQFPVAAVDDAGATGEVLVVDDFGNVVTNVPGEVLVGREAVAVDGESVPVGESFAAVPEGDRLVTVGSHGYVECDVNHGRGDEAFGLEPGDGVELSF